MIANRHIAHAPPTPLTRRLILRVPRSLVFRAKERLKMAIDKIDVVKKEQASPLPFASLHVHVLASLHVDMYM